MQLIHIGLITVGAFALSACGGGAKNEVPAANGTPASNGAAGSAPANTAPANKAADKKTPEKTPEDPEPYKKVSRTDPTGWVKLGREGQNELLRHTPLAKDKPPNYKLIAAITTVEDPGTKGEEEWNKWNREAVGAFLYFIDAKALDLEAAVKDNAPKVAAGMPEPKKDGAVAWSALQANEVMIAALSNKHGTYLVVGVIQDNAKAESHIQSMVKWAQSIKPQ